MKNFLLYLASLLLVGFASALLILSRHVEMDLFVYIVIIQSYVIGFYMFYLLPKTKKDEGYFIHIPHKDLK